MLKAIWRYRGFIWGLAARDFQSRYLNSILGSLWAILNPLAIIVVYTIIFSQVMRAKLPEIDNSLAYSIYMCAGLLPWNYFIETLQRFQNVFLEQGNLLKKVSFPRTSLPIYVVISSTINFSIIFGLFIVFLLITGQFPGWYFLGVFPLLLLQQMFAVGIGMFLGTINVFFRDIGHAFGVFLQFWFWLTPIVYPIKAVPEKFKSIFELNIMYPIVKSFQTIFVYQKWPQWNELFIPFLGALIMMLLGYVTFKKLEKEMVDEI
uniref:Transport permease protein n=1 Tax=Aneurinibacillus thermoaerophilus TaxID=143495 RepID=Q6T1X5_ANETH|nr:ABC-transporter protein [Aneurinibacillus thermoaerophilus]